MQQRFTGRTGDTLTPGREYNPDTLTHLGWTRGDGTNTAGFHFRYYFTTSGEYLGPDAHGIEPLVTNEDCPVDCGCEFCMRDRYYAEREPGEDDGMEYGHPDDRRRGLE